MNKLEWMPKNPHKTPTSFKWGWVDYLNDGKKQGFGEGSIATAKAILEHLIRTHRQQFIDPAEIVQMFSDLEKMK